MIIGITGTNGAGKGAVIDYLVKRKGFTHFSVRDVLVEVAQAQGLELNRPTFKKIGTALRRENEPGFFVRTFLARAHAINATNVVIDSLRTLAEAEYLQQQGGMVIAVDAPLALRYQRIVGRGTATDHLSLAEFRMQEDAEYTAEDPADPTQMNVLGVMAIANHCIINDGTLTALRKKIDLLLRENS